MHAYAAIVHAACTAFMSSAGRKGFCRHTISESPGSFGRQIGDGSFGPSLTHNSLVAVMVLLVKDWVKPWTSAMRLCTLPERAWKAETMGEMRPM